jgi:hypothetical protein
MSIDPVDHAEFALSIDDDDESSIDLLFRGPLAESFSERKEKSRPLGRLFS